MQPSFRNIVAITCGLGLATRRPGFIVKRLRSRWRRGQLLAVLETTISACAATAGFNEETVDRSYFSDAEIGDRAGKAVICGAYAIDELDDTASRRVLDMLREGAVRVGHTTLARDLTFFRNEGSAARVVPPEAQGHSGPAQARKEPKGSDL